MRLVTMTLLSLALASPSFGAVECGPRDDVLSVLHGQYHETRRGLGLAPDGVVMELFASAAGSWTIAATLPDGRTCIIAFGSDFMTDDEKPGIDG